VLSVLIPVYNTNCLPLVKSLNRQLLDSKIDYEIISIDDASTTHYADNDTLNRYSNTTYSILSENIGRSCIRNMLADKAKYQWLLFLDADTLPVNESFISCYIRVIESDPRQEVINGGLSYRLADMTRKNQLRYRYGEKRESIPYHTRNKAPYLSLLMSNTLIKRSVFQITEFNESIKKYGHEDSLFASDLKDKHILVAHIDNPVYHTGIEDNQIFIGKTKVAIENLWQLYRLGVLKADMNKLLGVYTDLSGFRMSGVLKGFYTLFYKRIEALLLKENPSLFLFDLFRLSYLSFIAE